MVDIWGRKDVKSKGNVVDPISEIEKYGVDAFRYCLMREVQLEMMETTLQNQ